MNRFKCSSCAARATRRSSPELTSLNSAASIRRKIRSITKRGWIAPEDGVHGRAEEMARTLMEHAPLTLRSAKRELNRILRGWAPPSDVSHVIEAYMSDDFKEGIESFLAKRKPRWQGK